MLNTFLVNFALKIYFSWPVHTLKSHVSNLINVSSVVSLFITQETFQQLREQQEKSGKPVDRNALFLEAVGGPDKKNRVYGVGSSQSLFYKSSTVMPFTPISATEEENQLLKHELIKINDRMKEVEKQLAMVMEATSLRVERSQSLGLDDQDDNN